MATELRRCLFIGLGGTGISTLLSTKRMFMETYGKDLPPMIGFLGIDTDKASYTKDIDSKVGRVKLEKNEQVRILCKDAKNYYNKHKNTLTWMPPENEPAIVALETGAGQIRTNGRLALHYNSSDLVSSIRTALDRVQNAQIHEKREFTLLDDAPVEIHMIFSMCGGTGAGTFIDMAYIVRHVANDCKLAGYAILPDVFESMVPTGPSMANVKPNAFGAIQDLDWLMNFNERKYGKMSFNYTDGPVALGNDLPFDTIMFIDNKNENEDSYNQVSQLTEMLSLGLVVSSGKISSDCASVMDNVKQKIAEGTMDVEGKKAWVSCMGAASLVFKGKDLAEIYSLKAAFSIIRILTNADGKADDIITAWIDPIREKDADNVIDFLLNKEPDFLLSDIYDPKSPKSEVEGYIKTMTEVNFSPKVKQLIDTMDKSLNNLMIEELNKECGIGNCKAILSGIVTRIDLYMEEMIKEKHDFETKDKISYEQLYTLAYDDLIAIANKTFIINKKRKMDEATEILTTAVRSYVISVREISRRNGAISFYTQFKDRVRKEIARFMQIEKVLNEALESIRKELVEKENSIMRTSRTFEIDLASSKIDEITCEDSELNIKEFAYSIDKYKGLYDVDNLNSTDLEKKILNFAKSLPKSKDYLDWNINKIIEEMKDDDFKHNIGLCSKKSDPLLKIDFGGHGDGNPKSRLENKYYIGVPNNEYEFGKKQILFNSLQDSLIPVQFTSTGMNDRIIFYRVCAVVPPFAVRSIQNYEEKAKKASKNRSIHFDNNIAAIMDSESFSLSPTENTNDALELWVKGWMFGLLKNVAGSYYYQSEKDGDPLNDFWAKIKRAPYNRKEAFDYFSSRISVISKEYQDFINKEEISKGLDVMEYLKDDIKNNYLDKYSQIGINPASLSKKGNESTKEMIIQELNFVKTKL